MGRECIDCQEWKTSSQFSSNQWRKGDGASRCKFCVGSNGVQNYNTLTYRYQCSECNRDFDSQNELNMHMQVHRPRNVSCPVCGDTRFRSGANAVQHVESGYCRGCRGSSNARQQIYNYASGQRVMAQYMSGAALLTNGDSTDDVPDFPYQCQQCSKAYRHLSQLLQHNDQKHQVHNFMLGIWFRMGFLFLHACFSNNLWSWFFVQNDLLTKFCIKVTPNQYSWQVCSPHLDKSETLRRIILCFCFLASILSNILSWSIVVIFLFCSLPAVIYYGNNRVVVFSL